MEIPRPNSWPVLLPHQVRAIDLAAAEAAGSGFLYMQRAGELLFHKVCELLDTGTWRRSFSLRPARRVALPQGWRNRPVLILAGHGNNGGDGVVLALRLKQERRDYRLLLLRDPSSFRKESAEAWAQYQAAGGVAEVLSSIQDLEQHKTAFGLVVDAMLGTGLNGPLTGIYSDIAAWLLAKKHPVLSVDVPTGMACNDQGHILHHEPTVIADWTLLMGFPRYEACNERTGDAFGQWDVADLGYSRLAACQVLAEAPLLAESYEQLALLLPRRSNWQDKRGQGVVGMVAGSKGMTGAAILCAQSAMRSGAGMVYLATPTTEVPVVASHLTEVVVQGQDSTSGMLMSSAQPSILAILAKANVGCIGPGLSVQNDVQLLVRQLILDADCPLVVDADGLNAFRGYSALLRGLKHVPVLTPHDGEWERLFRSPPGVGFVRIEALRAKAREYSCVIVLKGAPTLIGTPHGLVYMVPVANSGMAKAGSGDLLAGLIASLRAQGADAESAALLGTWVHARAGVLAVRDLGQRGVLPSDLLDRIPLALLELEQEEALS